MILGIFENLGPLEQLHIASTIFVSNFLETV